MHRLSNRSLFGPLGGIGESTIESSVTDAIFAAIYDNYGRYNVDLCQLEKVTPYIVNIAMIAMKVACTVGNIYERA